MLTVVTAADSQDLTTLSAVIAELDIAGRNVDGWVLDAITRASVTATRYCNRVFAVETVRETLRLRSRTETIALARWPIVSIVSMTEDGNPLIEGTDFETDPANGLLTRLDGHDNPTCWAAVKIVIQYQAGYVRFGTGRTLPAAIEQAVILMVKDAWFRRGQDPALKSETVEGVGSNSYWIGPKSDNDLPPEISGRLNRYRQPALG